MQPCWNDRLGWGINRDSGCPFEIPFTLHAADDPLKLTVGVEDKDLARVRVGHVDVVGGIHGNALRRIEAVLVPLARNELVFVLLEVKDVNAGRARVRHDDAAL